MIAALFYWAASPSSLRACDHPTTLLRHLDLVTRTGCGSPETGKMATEKTALRARAAEPTRTPRKAPGSVSAEEQQGSAQVRPA
jgi:hypothetical protein